eukprot:SAG22_NODE_300_length_12752_cov_3.102426_5_plen_303_part_00
MHAWFIQKRARRGPCAAGRHDSAGMRRVSIYDQADGGAPAPPPPARHGAQAAPGTGNPDRDSRAPDRLSDWSNTVEDAAARSGRWPSGSGHSSGTRVADSVRNAAATPLQGVRVAAAVVQHARRADQEHTMPVERLHAYIDALFPIIATVLFAKNFSEIPEQEAEQIKESCERAMENNIGATSASVFQDDCGWREVGTKMWYGAHGADRVWRLVSTCAVFALVYYDWLANVRIFRQVEHVSKFVVLLQMVWCIGATVYPLTLSPWMMGKPRARDEAALAGDLWRVGAAAAAAAGGVAAAAAA